jgi:aspartate aminotransferase
LEATITEKTKWLILNSPSNPTGSCYTIDEIRALADVLLKYEHVHILSDDIYEHLIFDGLEFATIAGVEPKLKNRVLTLNGVSKAYSMTGFRIGFAGGNATLIKAIATIQSQSTSNPCSISQKAAAEAISGEQGYLKDNAAIFEKRRDMVVGLLNKIEGIKCNVPNGAFYVFPSCEGLFGKKTLSGEAINNSTDFASFLLEEAKVAVVPGIAFGAEGFFRISYAASEDLLKDAIARIKDAVRILQ